MQQITAQLARIRSAGRWMLLTQRLCQWAAGLLAAAVGLAVLDWALRLPGSMRLAIGLIALGVAGAWLVTRLLRAARFSPSLADLALRAERLYPQLAGRLATAVEFAASPDSYREPVASATTGTLAHQAVGDAQRHMVGVHLGRLLNPARTLQMVGLLAVALVVIASLIFAAPTHAAMAAQRWFDPLGDHEWPTRVEVRDLTPDAALAADTPILLRAAITRGWDADTPVRAWHRTRMGDTVTTWEQAVLTPVESPTQSHGDGASGHSGDSPGTPALPRLYETLIDPPVTVSAALAQGDAARATFEFYFEAGDFAAHPRELILVPRPAVTRVTATVTPPAYALGLISPQTLQLHEQAGDVAAVTALQGSTIALQLAFNQPLTLDAAQARTLLPGVPEGLAITGTEGATDAATEEGTGVTSVSSSSGLTLRFTLTAPFDTPITLTNPQGLTSTTRRIYRFTPTPDASPTVALTLPASDEAVTANALIPVSALANDTIGVESLNLYAQPPTPTPAEGASAPGSSPPTTQPNPQTPPLLLTRATARQSSLTADATLDLATLPLQPGDELSLYATAQDTFRLPAQSNPGHDPVRSATRRLRIIDEATLVEQVRGDLATVRRAVERLARDQGDLNDKVAALPDNAPAPDVHRLETAQADLIRRVAAQTRAVNRLKERAVKNRVADETLNDVLDRGEALLDAADEAGDAARKALEDAREARAEHARRRGERPMEGEALQKQLDARKAAQDAGEQAEAALKELANLLDQGGDAWALQVALKGARAQQENIARDTRELLPQTMGRDPQDLDPQLKKELDDIAERQGKLNEEVADLLDKMRQTAGKLAKQGDQPEDAAAAQALAEAVAKAMQENLEAGMKDAQEQTKSNQLSKASSQQSDAARTMSKMLDELGKQREQLSEVLKRQMRELAQAIQALIEREQALVTQIHPLESPQVTTLAADALTIRTATMAAQELAAGEEKTAAVAPALGKAIEAQATGVQALRAARKAPAVAAHEEAVAQLQEALRLLEEAQKKEDGDEGEKEERAKRAQRYAALADRQEKLLAELTPLSQKEEPLDRRDRLSIRKMQPEQTAIRDDAAALGEEAGDTIVFVQSHKHIDAAAARSTDALGRSEATPVTLSDARQVALLLRSMADALKKDTREAPFDRPEGESPEGDGGGGGEPPDAIPPAAEVKLLKAMQQSLYDRTRSLHDQVGQARPNPAQEARLRGLSAEQRELHDAGVRLIQKLKPAEPNPMEPGSAQ